MAISISSRKAKGRRLQQWTARKISEVTGFECGTDCAIESRPMGQHGPDIRLEQNVLEVFPYSVECKSQESWAVPSWIKQASDNTYPNTDWFLVMKKNQQQPYVLLEGDLFFELLKKVHEYEKANNVQKVKD